MAEHEKLVANVIRAAGNHVVGRIRLQKIIYLLDQKGLKADAAFHYHHYGPYSRVIDAAIEKAKAFCGLSEELKSRMSDGAPFSVFHMPAGTMPSQIGSLESSQVRELVAKMTAASSTVLELAATIHWLVFRENIKDWRPELVKRKGAKTGNGRIDQALFLLRSLSLDLTG